MTTRYKYSVTLVLRRLIISTSPACPCFNSQCMTTTGRLSIGL